MQTNVLNCNFIIFVKETTIRIFRFNQCILSCSRLLYQKHFILNHGKSLTCKIKMYDQIQRKIV